MAWYRNHYHCLDCHRPWIDEWSCCCDDECPSCGKDYSPEESDDLSVVYDRNHGKKMGVPILASPPMAEHHPAYQQIAVAFTEKRAKLIAACLNTHLDLEEFFK